jgi:myo-inositol 2-dehydrogenase / D-chiro-inositol 1-dehydrogenase
MTDQTKQQVGRREFLGAAAAASFMILKPQMVRGTQANSQLRFGILGCGGRGTAVGTGFVENAGARVTALADLFGDQLETAHQHFDQIQQAKGYAPIDPAQLFKGPDAYQQIAASKEVDFILITTPPYFHPHHLETVVDAGKHVYCEKPVAVDVPGAHHAIQIGEKAKGKLSLEVGFQIRLAPPMVELTRRIHEGALGKVGCGLAFYYCAHIDRPEWPNASMEEKRLRNWVWDRRLSGDIIVEQNIHVIDMCNWMLEGHPEKAVGTGGRKYRTDTGDCWDNFNVLFTYPGDVQISFGSCQFGHPEFDAAVNLFGTEGASAAHYDWRVSIAGNNKWDSGLGPDKGAEQFSATGKFKGSLDQADPEKQRAFVASITAGQFHNQAALGAESAMSAMLGRTAAYKGQPVTWEELQKSKEVFDPKIDITKFAS